MFPIVTAGVTRGIIRSLGMTEKRRCQWGRWLLNAENSGIVARASPVTPIDDLNARDRPFSSSFL